MRKLSLFVLPFIGLSFPALAEENTSYPSLTGELSFEIEDDWTTSSDDPDAEINDLYPTVTLSTTAVFTPEISIKMEATLEPVEDAENDREFEDLGGSLNILTVNYETDAFSVFVGKFTPNFGIAWDAAPGLYGSDISGDYEYAEMIGLGGSINFNAAGAHTVSASSFFADTTFLSDSVGESRGPLEKSDGGLANTEDLSSFAIALDGGFSDLEGFRYHVGFSALSEGSDGEDHQFGYAAGVEYNFNINEDLTATPLFEYVYLDNYEGIEGDNAHFATAAFGLEYGGWSASTAYQRRQTETSGSGQVDYAIDLTVGYNFENGIGISGGWKHSQEEDIDSSGIGLLLSYNLEF